MRGGYKGLAYLNCKEGIDMHLSSTRAIEVDVVVSPDQVYLCSHEKVSCNSSIWLKERIDNRFTRLSLVQVLDYLKNNHEIRIILDCKFEKEYRMSQLRSLAQFIKEHFNGSKTILERIVFQIIEINELKILRDIYTFPILKNYGEWDIDYINMAKECIENDIKLVSLPVSSKVYYGHNIFKKCGINAYVYSVNTIEEYKKWISLEMSGVFSDFLTEEELEA